MKLLPSISTQRGLRPGRAAGQRVAAFTMLELALCLGIIGVALVAIIGVLPTGMQVQRDNREDTIIYQDAGYIMAAIRGGDNTNMNDTLATNLSWIKIYKNGILLDPFSSGGQYTATNGQISGSDIIGMLSLPSPPISIYSVQAKFWAGTGPVAASAPINRNFAFSYLLTPEVVPYSAPFSPTADPVYVQKLTNNLYEVRLNLRWPVLPNGNAGLGRKTYRTMISGNLVSNATYDLFYFQPNTYAP